MSCTLWFLSLYNTCTRFFDSVSHFYKKIRTVIYENKTYIFFKDIEYPVLENLTNVESSKSALPLWKYVADQYQFFEWYPGGTTNVDNCVTSHPLPMLSMEILDGDEVIYDLSSFIEKVRVYNSSQEELSPSVECIVAAWMLDAETVLNPLRYFNIRYIDENADTVTVPLYGLGPIDAESLDSDSLVDNEGA